MDTRSFPPSVVRETLFFLALTNRWFGGTRIVLDYLKDWPADRPLHILDAGCGGADISVDVARWARRAGISARVTAVDMMPEIAALAERNARDFPEIDVRTDDVFKMAEQGEKFDVVMASLFLHHCADPAKALQTFDRLARRGVIVSDLQRSMVSYGGVKTLSMLLGNHVVRHDGPLSVQRSFTTGELRNMAHEAGLAYLAARCHGPFRLSVAGWKNEPA